MALSHDPMMAGVIQITPQRSARKAASSDRTLGELLHGLAHQPTLATVETPHGTGASVAGYSSPTDAADQPRPAVVLADLRQLQCDLWRELAQLCRRAPRHP
jgi:hypothetical protein